MSPYVCFVSVILLLIQNVSANSKCLIYLQDNIHLVSCFVKFFASVPNSWCLRRYSKKHFEISQVSVCYVSAALSIWPIWNVSISTTCGIYLYVIWNVSASSVKIFSMHGSQLSVCYVSVTSSIWPPSNQFEMSHCT